MLATRLAIRVVHQIPGRARLAVHGLRRNPALARSITQGLAGVPGVLRAVANPVTGRVLVLYTPGCTDWMRALRHLVSVQQTAVAPAGLAPAGPPAKAPARPLAAVAAGPHTPAPPPRAGVPVIQESSTSIVVLAVLWGLFALRALLRRPPTLAASFGLFLASSAVSIAAGYPPVTNRLRGVLGADNTDRVLTDFSLALSVVRGNHPSLGHTLATNMHRYGGQLAAMAAEAAGEALVEQALPGSARVILPAVAALLEKEGRDGEGSKEGGGAAAILKGPAEAAEEALEEGESVAPPLETVQTAAETVKEAVRAGKPAAGAAEAAEPAPRPGGTAQAGRQQTVGRRALRPGQRIRVAGGETVPADGEVESGAAHVLDAWYSGLIGPRRAEPGNVLHAGSWVLEGELVLRVRSSGSVDLYHWQPPLYSEGSPLSGGPSQGIPPRRQEPSDREQEALRWQPEPPAQAAGTRREAQRQARRKAAPLIYPPEHPARLDWAIATYRQRWSVLALAGAAATFVATRSLPATLAVLSMGDPRLALLGRQAALQAGMVALERRRVYMRAPQDLAQAGEVRRAVVAGPGLVTEGRFRLTGVVPLAAGSGTVPPDSTGGGGGRGGGRRWDEVRIRALAWSLLRGRNHPLACREVWGADAGQGQPTWICQVDADTLSDPASEGVSGWVTGAGVGDGTGCGRMRAWLGTEPYIARHVGGRAVREARKQAAGQLKAATQLWFLAVKGPSTGGAEDGSKGAVVVGVLGFHDPVTPGGKALIRRLRQYGVPEIVVLYPQTGREGARRLARELGPGVQVWDAGSPRARWEAVWRGMPRRDAQWPGLARATPAGPARPGASSGDASLPRGGPAFPHAARGTALDTARRRLAQRAPVLYIGNGPLDTLAMQAAALPVAAGRFVHWEAVRLAGAIAPYPAAAASMLPVAQAVDAISRQNLALAVAFNVAGSALAAARRISSHAAAAAWNYAGLAQSANAARLLGPPPAPGSALRLRPLPSGPGAQRLATRPPLYADVPVRPPVRSSSAARPEARSGALSSRRAAPPPALPWHALPLARCLDELGVSAERGLSLAQVRAAWAHYGDGGLPSSPEPSAWSLLAAQFKDFTVLALLGAAGVLACLGNFTDAAAIGAILAVNAALATTQELKAQRLLRALRQRSRPQVRVVRAGERRQIDPSQLVPGDILLLQAGEQVPADARLLEAVDLQTDESSLTGESLPVAKGSGAALQAGLPPGTPLAERINMVYAGSAVVRGRARALVVATGAHTEMGSVWKAVRQARQQYTPLQEQLLRLGHRLLRLSMLAGSVVFLLGVLRRQPLLLMVMTGLSMAVAAVPEGLPAIITVGLSMGVQRLVRRQAVVQHLGAVETLGRANLLCSDKTGTLTINRMKVRAVLPAQEILSPLPGFAAQTGARRLTTIIAALCNNAPADPDPTEQALLEHARQEGLDVERLRTLFSRRAEIPFDSMRSRMSVVVQLSPRPAEATTEQILLCKGAPDVIVGLSTSYWDGEAPRLLTDSQRQALLRYVDEVASQGLRVLAAGFRLLSGQGRSGESSAPGLSAALLLARGGDPYGPAAGSDAQLEANLCLAGFVALADPPRPEARESLEHCHRNGVRVLMITGDQLPTSVAIARELRLAPGGADPEALLAPELDALDDDAALRRLQRVHVVARATPRHKLRIVRLMKRAGYILALTGDGANDAPALKAADVGIAMGRAGTDVSRAASSLVLADDNFSTIVHALEEGRLIRDNLNRSLGYLVSGNLGELLAVTGAVLLGWPAPLLPIHLLLVNLFTDALPAIALARTPPAEALQPPARVGAGDFQMTPRNWLRSALLGGTTLALYRSGMDASPAAAQSMALASLVGTQLLSALDWRAEGRPPLRRWLGKDAFFLAMLGGSAAGLAAVLHWPPLQRFFKTTPLSFSQWAGVGAAAAGSSLLARLAGRESLRPDRQVFKAHRGRRCRAPACANPRPPAHP